MDYLTRAGQFLDRLLFGVAAPPPDAKANIPPGTSAALIAGAPPVNTVPIVSTPGIIGVSPAANAALSSAAVWACCRLISNSIASLPTDVFRIADDGSKTRATNHPAYRLLTRSPNPDMTVQQWISPTLLSLLLWGNAYTWKYRVNDEVFALYPLNPARVQMSLQEDGSFGFTWTDLRGQAHYFTDEDIIHFRLFTIDGYFGLPVLVYHQMTMSLQQASNQFALNLLNRGGQPAGVLKYNTQLRPEQAVRIRESWRTMHAGPQGAGQIAILEEGASYQAITIPPEQLQYVEQERFSVEQIARIFGVPPHMVGASAQPTYASVEQESIEFSRYTQYPYVKQLEQCVDRALFGNDPTLQWKFNLDAFERGDIASRYQSYATGRQWGWFSVNDVRRLENMNPVEGGDEYLTPLNMVSSNQPGATPPAPPPPRLATPKPTGV